MSTNSHGPTGGDDTREALRQLELRIARIEEYLRLPEVGAEAATVGTSVVDTASRDERGGESLEIELGQNWFAKVGIVILSLGVLFLLTLPYGGYPAFLPSLAGYGLAAGTVGLGRRLLGAHPRISRYLVGAATLLFYFATLRLSFFGAVPAVANRDVLAVLLLIVVGLNLVVAARRRSAVLAAMQVGLGCLTCLWGGGAWLGFGALTAMAGVSVALRHRYNWTWVPLAAAAAVGAAHAAWVFGNPLLGNRVRVVSGPEANLAFLLVYAAVFAAGNVVRNRSEKETPAEISGAVLNGGFYVLLLFLTLTGFSAHLVAWNLVAAASYLGFAVAFWVRRRTQFSTFIYAMIGYTAVSAAIVGTIRSPEAFVWLCWQSILVVTTAVWFRSRFIVVANFLIFLAIFAAYLFSSGPVTLGSICFGVVALASARILNWQRNRLDLKTELMRNAYLATALFVIPYALYHAVPRGFVSLSWLGVAAGYYVASRVLANAKYRWMALLTMALTVVWVFAVDLVALSPALRIVSFLVLGTALLGISMVYGRNRRKATGGP